MSGSIIGELADSIRLQTANKQLQRGPDLAWAERIMEKQARGERVGFHAAKLAGEALAELNRRRQGGARGA